MTASDADAAGRNAAARLRRRSRRNEPLDEMYAPGGIAWDELAAFPNLADYEPADNGEGETCRDLI